MKTIAHLLMLLAIFANNDPMDFTQYNDLKHLEEWHGKKIRLRGFLYSNQKNEWILACEANLKSCCIGSKEKAAQQLFLKDGSWDKGSLGLVVEVEGIFKYEPDNLEGHHYFLEKPRIIKKDKSTFFFILVGLGMMILAAYAWTKRKG